MDRPDHLIVGLGTRNRLVELRRCITSIASTAGIPVKIVVAFDEDYASYIELHDYPYVSKVLLQPRHYYCRMMNVLYRKMHEVAEEEGSTHFVLAHDDSEYALWDWGNKALDIHMGAYPDGNGVVDLFGPSMCSHYISTFKFIDEQHNGQLADPRYTMYYSDSDMLNKLAEKTQYAAIEGMGIFRHMTMSTHDALTAEVTRTWKDLDRQEYERRWPKEYVQELKKNWKIALMDRS